ncbi:MAG: M14 family zinc carboxypeptidase [Candidatus Krumholzibacteria bacterium]|nr:M14 family zinc carboxypeptidase [Candidatus Krumholzibacteria bacterium]
MRRYIMAVLAALSLIGSPVAQSHSRPQPATSVVRVKLTKEVSQRALLERGVDIMHIYPDGRADLAVNDEQLDWITSKGPLVAVLERIDLAAPAALDANLGLYYTYAEMTAAFDSLADAYPSLTLLDTLGTSYEGRSIVAIKISDNAASDESEPEVLMMGCHHARELMSVEVPVRFAKYLLDNYGIDDRATALVDGREIWIVPMINVDGHVYVENNHSGSSVNWWRKNRRPNSDGSFGIDLNRNYGYNWGYDDIGSSPEPSSVIYRGTMAFSELETAAVRDFCAAHEFAVSLSYHSYGELILYPWGYAALNTPDDDIFSALGDSMAQGNDYLAGNAASGAIYITNGDSDDWLYGDRETKGAVYGFTVEVNSWDEGGFSPAESLIMPTFDKLLGLNLTLIDLADDLSLIVGPEAPTMNSITMLDPPSYKISWSEPDAGDLNPVVSYELTEIKNLSAGIDSVEAGDTLWKADGFALSSERAYAGSYSFYSGRGDELHCTLSMANIYPVWLPSTFSCCLWYDIEEEWDYAYLEASTDDGATWVTVPGDRTTDYDPNGTNRGNGITGASSGWVSATFDLSDSMVSERGFILLRFVYITDESMNNEGIYVDLVDPAVRIERESAIATDYTSTSFNCTPRELGDFVYYVKGFDADGRASKRSNLAEHEVNDLSDSSGAGPFASRLEQNYPNPFNPATTIEFSVGDVDAPGGRKVHASLRLYDVSGHLVSVLKEGMFSANRYSAEWNGLGKDGEPVASGIYFAELRLKDKVLVRKMVLLR